MPTAAPFASACDFQWDAVPRPGAELMERDASRLLAVENGRGLGPSFVLYTWDRPTVSLGYAQDAEATLDLDLLARDGIPVVRRPTGGRAVFHVDEWTYGAVVPLDHPTLGGSLAVSCRALTRLIARALVTAYRVPLDGEWSTGRNGERRDRSWSAACFAEAHGYEITAAGRKLVGSAQRRLGRALLQQGSLLVGPGHERLARYARGGPDRGMELDLARASVTLAELVGARPDVARFASALARAWQESLDSLRGRS